MQRALQLMGGLTAYATACGLALAAVASSGCASSSSAPSPPVDGGPFDAPTDALSEADAPDDPDADAAPPACALGFLGDPTQPTVMQLLVRDASGMTVALAEGDQVPLVTPPQGGKVVFVGVRATNISPCSVTLTGSLRDPVSQQLRLDGRGMNLTPTGDGWGVSADSNLSTFANIPVCPNQWAMQDAYGQVFELTVKLSDPAGHAASTTIHVTPVCGEPGPSAKECACTCKQGYVLGQVCN